LSTISGHASRDERLLAELRALYRRHFRLSAREADWYARQAFEAARDVATYANQPMERSIDNIRRCLETSWRVVPGAVS
jgi:hypothetical protein